MLPAPSGHPTIHQPIFDDTTPNFAHLPTLPPEDLARLDNLLGNIPPPAARSHPVPTSATLQISRIARKLHVYHDKFLAQRNRVLLERDAAAYEWESSRYKANFVRESRVSLSEELEAVASKFPSEPAFERLRGHHDQLFSDYEAFAHQIEKIQALEVKLHKETERELQETEKCIVETTHELLGTIDDLGLEAPNDDQDAVIDSPLTSPHSAEQKSEAGPRLHPTVALYYDKIADCRIMRERVGRLLAELEEESIARGFREDQGALLELSNEEFSAWNKEELSHARQELQDAIDAAEVARSACIEEGVDSQIDEKLLDDGLLDYREVDQGAEGDDSSAKPSTLAIGPPKLPFATTTDLHRVLSSSRISTVTGILDYSAAGIVGQKCKELQYDRHRIEGWIDGVNQVEPPGANDAMTQSTPTLPSVPSLLESQHVTGEIDDENDWEHVSKQASPEKASLPDGTTTEQAHTSLEVTLARRSSSESRLLALAPRLFPDDAIA